MDRRGKVFLVRNPYAQARTAPYFIEAVRQNLRFHYENCPEYAKLLSLSGFDPNSVQKEEDIANIPPIPTFLLKQHRFVSLPKEKLILHATSSGTGGVKSVLAFDRRSAAYGIGALARLFAHLKLISAIPANYVIFSYPPGEGMELGASKTARGATRFAPAIHRVYALKSNGSGGYEPNIEGLSAALSRFARSPFPVRFTGFPGYFYALCLLLENQNKRLVLPKGSLAMLGGGFKSMEDGGGAEALYSLANQTLGLPRARIFEFFSAAEHPVAYYKCINGHFHIPSYSRVIIRNVDTLAPVPDGEPGLLNFVTPLVTSMPLLCVMTDDVAVRCEGGCGCGIESPYFKLLGRAGRSGIATCAVQAAELLTLNGEGGAKHV